MTRAEQRNQQDLRAFEQDVIQQLRERGIQALPDLVRQAQERGFGSCSRSCEDTCGALGEAESKQLLRGSDRVLTEPTLGEVLVADPW